MRSHDITVIEAGRSRMVSLHEMWQTKEIFLFLVWRDILVRYKQTVIGIAWVVIRPLLTMLVFSVLFGKIAALPSGGIPYPILVLSALLPWQFFSDSLFFGSGSLVANASMIGKVYFPRIFIPASSVMCCLLDLGVSLVLLAVFLMFYQFTPPLNILLFPAILAWLFMLTLAITVGISALMVRYRDFKYIVSFGIQLGLYVSPVGFSSTIIPLKWRLLYSLNPLVGIIDGFRWALVGEPLYLPGMLVSLGVTVICVIGAFAYFQTNEQTFADVV